MRRDARNEEERIREAYARREARDDGITYTWFNPATAFHLQRQEQAVLGLLRREGITSLAGLKILEVGCGAGSELRNFIKYGASPEMLYGVDILEERIEQGQAVNPAINFMRASAESLPFTDGFFDLVCQFVMFTSILDDDVKKTIATEMMRVLRPGGLIIWYDYYVSRPGNADVKGVGRSEIIDLFPGCSVSLRRVTLAAPIARAVAPRSRTLATALELLPPLRSHFLGAIRLPAGVS